MRKFLVAVKVFHNKISIIASTEVELGWNDKANVETFTKLVNDKLKPEYSEPIILSWSLIEEPLF